MISVSQMMNLMIYCMFCSFHLAEKLLIDCSPKSPLGQILSNHCLVPVTRQALYFSAFSSSVHVAIILNKFVGCLLV